MSRESLRTHRSFRLARDVSVGENTGAFRTNLNVTSQSLRAGVFVRGGTLREPRSSDLCLWQSYRSGPPAVNDRCSCSSPIRSAVLNDSDQPLAEVFGYCRDRPFRPVVDARRSNRGGGIPPTRTPFCLIAPTSSAAPPAAPSRISARAARRLANRPSGFPAARRREHRCAIRQTPRRSPRRARRRTGGCSC